MSSSISNQIDLIIQARKNKLPEIEKQIDRINQAREGAKQMAVIKSSILNENGELNPKSPYYALFSESPEMIAGISGLSVVDFMDTSAELLEKYEELKTRFSRDYINIAVVGTARQGKSQFLKTVSGLDDRCIPAFTGGHCTGASSVIQNSPNNNVVAEIYFKTEAEIVEEVQGYLDNITNKRYSIGSISDVPHIDKSRINALIEEIEEHKKPVAVGQKNTLFHRFVDHFNDWYPLLGKQKITVTDENEIMTYVAQHNGKIKDRKEFYKFVAVKKAIIKKAFEYADTGKIRMIDTEGLGAVTTNTESNMIDTIKNESDAVIFFKRPEPGFLGEPTSDEHSVFGRLRAQFKDRMMDKWFAFLINHTSEVSPSIHENGQQCKEYFTYIENNRPIPTLKNAIVNVADRNTVIEEFLVPFLTGLTRNLSEIDAIYLSEAQPLAERAYASYEALCASLNRISKMRFSSANNIYYVGTLINRTYEKMINAIAKNHQEMEKNRNEVCEELSDQVTDIIDNMMSLIPPEKEIEAKCNETAATADELFRQYLDTVRNELTKKFIGVDTSLEMITNRFKNRIADYIISKDLGMLEIVMDGPADADSYHRLYSFAERKIDEEEYPQIKKAIEFLCEFEFGVRGFLMNKLRSNLYEISRTNPNVGRNLDFMDGSHSIYFNLMIKIRGIQDKLREEFIGFFTAPNEALFAISDEFFDRVYYSEGVRDEWRKLYSEYYMQLWGAELTAQAKNKEVAQLWLDNIEKVFSLNKMDNFILRTE